MKFLIKNYSKDENDEKGLLATVLFEVETIKEAQEKGFIKIFDEEAGSKAKKYIPVWS